MPQIAILVYDNCYASVAAGIADILHVANAHLRKQDFSEEKMYRWTFVSRSGGSVDAGSGMHWTTGKLRHTDRFDVVFIPSLHYTGRKQLDQFLAEQAPIHRWLVAQWKQGAWLAANCTGTFLLAATGLLDGRIATTTWWLEQQFRQRYPEVLLQMQPMITEENRLVCGGAYASFLVQAVRILERFSGTGIASASARSMLIDLSQTAQTPLLALTTDLRHDDALVTRAQQWLQEHMAQTVSMSGLAGHLGISNRTLIRRFHGAIRLTPLAYLQNLRIDAARSLLENAEVGGEQLAHRVGYSDVSSFVRLFRQRTGVTPAVYRARFRSR